MRAILLGPHDDTHALGAMLPAPEIPFEDWLLTLPSSLESRKGHWPQEPKAPVHHKEPIQKRLHLLRKEEELGAKEAHSLLPAWELGQSPPDGGMLTALLPPLPAQRADNTPASSWYLRLLQRQCRCFPQSKKQKMKSHPGLSFAAC